jgi:hypothetical protein
MTRLTSTRTLLAFFSLALVFSACDSGGASEDEVDNQFSFTVTPVSSSTSAPKQSAGGKNLSGYSFFIDADEVDGPNDEAFVIYFSGNESFSEESATTGLFGFAARNSGRPGTGPFPITDGSDGDRSPSDFIAWLYEDVENTQNTPYYSIQDGTLSFSTSDDDKVAGDLEGTAVEYRFTSVGLQTDTVNVSGSFTAEDLDTYVPYGSYVGAP